MRAPVTLALSFFFAVAVLSGGCASYNPEELDRLTKEDPNFKQMIVARDAARGEIRGIKADLLGRKRALDGQVERLRGEYDEYAKAQSLKIDKYRDLIETSRNVLRREMETASAQLTAKEAELGRLQKTQAEVAKVLRQSRDITLSRAEREKWEERSLMISEKIRPLTEEIEELSARIRLAKRKIGFLR